MGKMAFTELTGVKLGEAIVSRGVSAFFAGSLAGLLLSVGAETSRAIYTSRDLEDRNPVLHNKLQRLGDLDLLYFIVEDIVKPFEIACEVGDRNPAEFDKVCEYFSEAYENQGNSSGYPFSINSRGGDGAGCFWYCIYYLVFFLIFKRIQISLGYVFDSRVFVGYLIYRFAYTYVYDE